MATLTKNELIDILQKIPDNPKVLVDGYEGGLSDLTKERVFEEIVILNQNEDTWWNGRHQILDGKKDLEDYDNLKHERPAIALEKVIVFSRLRTIGHLSKAAEAQELANQILTERAPKT